MKKVYTLHEYGAPSHFYALEYLVKQEGLKLYHRELNYYKQLRKLLKGYEIACLSKLIDNIFFLITLIFTKDKTIVLGIAPYNYWLKYLKPILSRHNTFYFTSFTCWDQSRMVHKKYYSPKLLNVWRKFLNNDVRHTFVVSKQASKELIRNGFTTENKITIVNHSYQAAIVPSNSKKKTNRFISVSTLSRTKGIDELLNIFMKMPDCEFTIIGQGTLQDLVVSESQKYPNINYIGFIKGLKNIIPYYKENSFLLLNSRRIGAWEELFGIVLIEGMACGLIPIATDHPGPIEVISHRENGFICQEGQIEYIIKYVLTMDDNEFWRIKKNAILTAEKYRSSFISQRWKPVLIGG